MAKIRTAAYTVHGQRVEFTLKYHAKRSKFEFDLPPTLEEYRDAGDLECPAGASESEAVEKLRALIAKYESQKMNERKVIAYKLDASSENVKTRPSGYRREGYNTDEVKLEFHFQVLLERSVDESVQFYTQGEDWEGKPRVDSTRLDTDEYQIIEWTAEREAFMSKFYSSVEDLIRRLKSVTDTPESMAQVADTQAVLLELPAPVKKGKTK